MKTDPGWYMMMWHLLDALLMPYKNLIIMYITSDILLWQLKSLLFMKLNSEVSIFRLPAKYGKDILREPFLQLHQQS
jgi:hypothetical protein